MSDYLVPSSFIWGIDNGWFVYFHDQWCIIGSFYSVFKHFEIIVWLLLLTEFWPSVDLKSLLFLVSPSSCATPKSTKPCPILATPAILRWFRLSLISVNVGPHTFCSMYNFRKLCFWQYRGNCQILQPGKVTVLFRLCSSSWHEILQPGYTSDDHGQWMHERCSFVYLATNASSVLTTYCREKIPKYFPEHF